jgi:uncharacterized protein
MAEPSEPEPASDVGADAGIYVDASALAKVYVPEPESDVLDAFLRGRRGLMISELAVTEVLSAVALRKRAGELRVKQANDIRNALLADASSGSFGRLDLSPAVHREAERLLFATGTIALRTLDALHIALAFSGNASHILTFDRRMGDAAIYAGLDTIELSA